MLFGTVISFQGHYPEQIIDTCTEMGVQSFVVAVELIIQKKKEGKRKREKERRRKEGRKGEKKERKPPKYLTTEDWSRTIVQTMNC